MQTKPKANSIVTSIYDAPSHAITYTVRDGEHIVGEMTLHLNKVHPDNLARGLIAGFNQRIPDAAAINATPPPKDATPEQKAALTRTRCERKHALMARLVDHYNAGTSDWSIPRVVVPAGSKLDDMMLAAVAEAMKRTVDEVRDRVTTGCAKHNMTPADYLTHLCTTAAAVIPILARMRTEAPKPPVDADAELAGMFDDGDGEPDGEEGGNASE
jgi:hypothetical protein